jgi:hypothetical protein
LLRTAATHERSLLRVSALRVSVSYRKSDAAVYGTIMETAEKLLADALYLLNDRRRFGTRDRSLDSYEVAGRISSYLRDHAAASTKRSR